MTAGFSFVGKRNRLASHPKAGGHRPPLQFQKTMNYFEVFELPQLLGIDTAMLEKKFHQLSRSYHPDYYTTAPAEEKSRALRMTALLNDAYRTLRHPTRRVEYLLSLHGYKSDGSKVPQSLLLEVFEINEQLEEFRLSHGDSKLLED